jgi:hypothetical protein
LDANNIEPIIATARIIIAIVPNAGTTVVLQQIPNCKELIYKDRIN